MALLTESSLKLLQERIHDAEYTLKAQLDTYEKSLNEHRSTKDRTKVFEEDYSKILEDFKQQGVVEVEPFLELLDNLHKKQRERSSAPSSLESDEVKEARGYEFVLEGTIPFHYTEDQVKDLLEDYNNGGLSDKHNDIRADHDKALKQINEDYLDQIAVIHANIETLKTETEVKKEKDIADAEDGVSKAKDDYKKAVEGGVDSEIAAADAVLKAAEQTLKDAVDSRKRLDQVDEFIDNIKDEIMQIYDDHTKSSRELSMSQMVYEYTLKPLTKYVEEGKNSDLLKQFEEEQEVRKEIAKEVKDNSRVKPLIAHKNTGVEDKMREFESDTDIIIKEIKSELEIDSEVEQRINADIESLFERYNNAKDKDLTDVNFSKDDALELTRQSLYDLAISGIIKKIKQACYKGDTSIKLSEDEVSATHLIALHKAGYKVTHEAVRRPGRGKADTIFVIDWGFVSEH